MITAPESKFLLYIYFTLHLKLFSFKSRDQWYLEDFTYTTFPYKTVMLLKSKLTLHYLTYDLNTFRIRNNGTGTEDERVFIKTV